MNRGLPSMTALLGLLAIAGYQNRDKLAEMFSGGSGAQPAGGGQNPADAAQPGGLGGILGGLGSLFGGGSGSSPGNGDQLVSGGLKELIDRFKETGHGEDADSWVASGPNRPVSSEHLEHAIGPDVLATLSQQTGLSREELLARLTRELPDAVDRYTPDGRLPT
ncbi:MAG TPA: YidB family protein [Geminicoccus sp.]|uniref:YidB family protein n=1 Tax=Geminicoccus sp. TaxID=2024832 RepID=UPI002BDED390|nr:YidB family protein [Geminicoccus sp.]HWL67301.1 YidB family protein [Geminicoccus sp.]